MKTRRKSDGRLIGAAILVATCLLAFGCLRSTEAQPSLLQLIGIWNYTGVQTGPVPETLSGTLMISLESGTSFQGQIALFGVTQNGSRSLNGSVSGSESGSGVVDFDANLDMQRRHVGQIVADTITGTWVGSSAGGTVSSGTFRIEREPR